MGVYNIFFIGWKSGFGFFLGVYFYKGSFLKSMIGDVW